MKLFIKESLNDNCGIIVSERMLSEYVRELIEYYGDNGIIPSDETVLDSIYEDFTVLTYDEYQSKPYRDSFVPCDDVVNRVLDTYNRISKSWNYGILCKNRGMWGGISSWMTSDGKTLRFPTEKSAQNYVDKFESGRSRVNNFTSYFVKRID